MIEELTKSKVESIGVLVSFRASSNFDWVYSMSQRQEAYKTLMPTKCIWIFPSELMTFAHRWFPASSKWALQFDNEYHSFRFMWRHMPDKSSLDRDPSNIASSDLSKSVGYIIFHGLNNIFCALWFDWRLIRRLVFRRRWQLDPRRSHRWWLVKRCLS